jgi:hypothetical protein
MMRSPPERQLRWQTEPVWRTDPHGKIGASKEAPVQPTIIESADYIAAFKSVNEPVIVDVSTSFLMCNQDANPGT